MKNHVGSEKILIFFHGNAEDIGLSFELLESIQDVLQIHTISVEYPGYGLYKTEEPSAEGILRDAEAVFDYLVEDMGVEPE